MGNCEHEAPGSGIVCVECRDNWAWRHAPHEVLHAMIDKQREFDEIHTRVGRMHGYAHAADCMVRAHNQWACTCGADGLVLESAHNGLSPECRANRHEDCVDAGCVCACHGVDE